MKSYPYLSFPGTCEEALRFYQSILGGEIGELNYYDDSPMASPDSKGKIMHTQYSFGDENLLMAADVFGHPVPTESNITLSINVGDLNEAERIFSAMSDGGQVIVPLADTFWGARFGMWTDKFGINWMINCELSPTE